MPCKLLEIVAHSLLPSWNKWKRISPPQMVKTTECHPPPTCGGRTSRFPLDWNIITQERNAYLWHSLAVSQNQGGKVCIGSNVKHSTTWSGLAWPGYHLFYGIQHHGPISLKADGFRQDRCHDMRIQARGWHTTLPYHTWNSYCRCRTRMLVIDHPIIEFLDAAVIST